jgi:hypothetical protein
MYLKWLARLRATSLHHQSFSRVRNWPASIKLTGAAAAPWFPYYLSKLREEGVWCFMTSFHPSLWYWNEAPISSYVKKEKKNRQQNLRTYQQTDRWMKGMAGRTDAFIKFPQEYMKMPKSLLIILQNSVKKIVLIETWLTSKVTPGNGVTFTKKYYQEMLAYSGCLCATNKWCVSRSILYFCVSLVYITETMFIRYIVLHFITFDTFKIW